MKSLSSNQNWKRQKWTARSGMWLIALGLMMMPGCSTMGIQSTPVKPPSVSFQDYCPPPQTFADWNTFKAETKVVKGESPFATVKRFRLAEREKNASAQRLWTGMKACRSKKVEIEVTAKKKEAVSDILAGGL